MKQSIIDYSRFMKIFGKKLSKRGVLLKWVPKFETSKNIRKNYSKNFNGDKNHLKEALAEK
jgi:hypothetical protein